MATIIPASTLLPLSTVNGGSIPGDAATGHLERDIKDVVSAIERYNSKFWGLIGKDSPGNQVKLEWMQRRQRPHRSNLNGSHTNATTTITLPLGHAARFQVYNVATIVDSTNGDEVIHVTAINTTADTLTVERGYSGTTAVAHGDGAIIELHGSALPYGKIDFVPSPVQYGDFSYNYYQRFQGGIQEDDAFRFTPNRERQGDQLNLLVAEETKNQLLQMEKAFIWNKRQAPVNGSTAGTLGGIQTFITTNVTNLGGGVLSVYDLESIAKTIWDNSDTSNLRLMVSGKSKQIINRTLNPFRMASMNDTSAELRLDSVDFEFGTVDFLTIPYMKESEIWGLDFSQIKKVPYTGMDWRQKQMPTNGAYSFTAVTADYSLKVLAEAKMFRIYNFNTDLASYPQLGA